MNASEVIAAVSPETDEETVFPWRLVEEVLDILQERDVRFFRYCDLHFEKSWCGSRLRYLDEYIKFRSARRGAAAAVEALGSYAGLRWGHRFPTLRRLVVERSRGLPPPAVVLQHDADLLPEKTVAMMNLERRRGVRSSNYFFVRHASEKAYGLDVPVLQALEREGFEIGYHQNAFERASYKVHDALKLAAEDLQWLRGRFSIRSFVPHGGEASRDGRNNEHLPHAGELKTLLWAYNGKCILKDYTWSDGGIKKHVPQDPREFAKGLVQGSRAMLLMHPQYYGCRLRSDWDSLPISGSPWWRKLWGL